jgi:Domain of unknown function (DUF4384)
MDYLSKVETLDDILHDLEGAEKLGLRLEGSHEFESKAVTTRGFAREDFGTPSGIGRRLLIGCEESTLRRYEMLFRFEPHFDPRDDFGYLIGPASQILEAELRRLLFEPARLLAPALVSAMGDDPRSGKRAAILEQWAEAKIPTTIGIGSLLLMALRRCCAAGSESIRDFLDSRFAPAYRELLMTNGPACGLDIIREQFRNPACHGTASFDASAYREFARLTIANRGFASWDERGSDPPDPDPGSGILHHHLYLSHQRSSGEASSERIELRSPSEAALARLLALPVSGSLLEIQVRVVHGREPHKTRDISTPGRPIARPFRLGNRIKIEFETNRHCHVALLDFGTSGSVAVLWPNVWCGTSKIETGRVYSIPGPETSELDFILTGRPGLERIMAIATSEPLSVRLLPESGLPFRTLESIDLAKLADGIKIFDEWFIAVCEFRVEP